MDIKKIIYKKLSTRTNKKFDDESDIYKIGIDSLDLLELITDAEDELGIRISDEDLSNIKKVGDIEKAIKKASK